MWGTLFKFDHLSSVCEENLAGLAKFGIFHEPTQCATFKVKQTSWFLVRQVTSLR